MLKLKDAQKVIELTLQYGRKLELAPLTVAVLDVRRAHDCFGA